VAANVIRDPVAKAFREIHPKNPLNQLDDSDRRFLWASLMLYADVAKRKRKRDAVFDGLERVSKIVADAAKAAARLELEVVRGPFSEQLRPFIVGFEDLPIRFSRFSKQLENVLYSTGKPGRKRKTLSTEFLIQASEFVQLKFHQPYDDHLAELFQQMGHDSLSKKMCGETIRKKREYLKKHYPVPYAIALKTARNHCKNSTSPDPS